MWYNIVAQILRMKGHTCTVVTIGGMIQEVFSHVGKNSKRGRTSKDYQSYMYSSNNWWYDMKTETTLFKTEATLLKVALILCTIVFLYLIYRDYKIEKEVLNCEDVCENSIERATITLLEEKVKDLNKKLEKCKNKKEVDCVYRQAL